MRVLQINVLGRTLSTGRTTREMHEELLDHGIESFIATACNKDCNDAFAITSMFFMHIDAILTIITGLELYHSFIHTKRFINYIDSIKPDIVHLRVLHNSYINLGVLLRYLAKKDIATVITLHDLWFITGKCTHYINYKCNKWQTGCYNCPALKDDSHRKWFDRTYKMWSDKKKWLNAIPRLAVVGNSDWTTEQARKSFLDSSKKVLKIYNWIDLNTFYPRDTKNIRSKFNLDNKYVILGVATNWNQNDKKGFSTFINLAKALPQEFQIVLVGNIEYSGILPSNVTNLKKTNDIDLLANYYSMSDVFLNLSMEETFGKASAEAVACGTPIIAIDRCANKEIVPDGAGYILKSINIKEILFAINEIKKQDKNYYTNKCLTFVKQNFSKINNINQYIQLYKELIMVKKS